MEHVTRNKNQSGVILILALVFMVIVLGLVGSLVGYAGVQIRGHKQSTARAEAINIAEAGAETAIWKLNNVLGYNGEVGTVYAGGEYDVTITNISGSSKLIRVDAYVPSKAGALGRRSVQITATTGSTNVGFNYGVHIGQGGLEMVNNSRIIGNAYSNGNITGNNSARIEGTAIVSGATGVIDGMDVDVDTWSHTIRGNSNVGRDARHAVLQNTDVDRNVIADSISSCTIGGTATYDTRTGCSVTGATTTPNPTDFVSAEVLPLPITEEQIDTWEVEASSGGTIGSQSFSSGSRTMGPVKIDGDLILSGTSELVMTGTIWVTGQLKMSNSAILRLHSAYGAQSGVIVAGIDENTTAGYIEIDNSTQVLGSGTSGSYLMMLSQKEGTASVAISQKNGTGVAILYAGEGLIEIANSSSMKEVTAYKLRITNFATVQYESGLGSTIFSSGPAGGWETGDESWQLLN